MLAGTMLLPLQTARAVGVKVVPGGEPVVKAAGPC
jgi:hypothetical protein